MSNIQLQDKSLTARVVLLHMMISALSLLAGYAAGYVLLRNIVISDADWVKEVIQNLYLQLLCCLPGLVVISPIPALISILLNTKLRLTNTVAFLMSGVCGVAAGVAIFIPAQWLLLFGAAL
jgi:type III secretory pathway component EscS